MLANSMFLACSCTALDLLLLRVGEGDVRFLICTDVAARGLDIKELPCVINMTLPDKEEDYIHRVGRVGRAEVVGLAVSLVASGHREKVWYYDRRKWEGRPLSTKLAELGGCCIWYDEPALLRGVQKRLGGGEVETLDAFLARLPGGVRSLNASLGQAKENGLDAASAERLLALAPTVATLEALETRAQLSFLLGPTALSQRAAAGDDVALRGGAASLGSQPPSPAIAGPDSVASKGAKGRHTHRARQRGGRGRTK
ncbi:hypothetical protein EMIHUDRAFT_96119 [Emiliania huxleyi CCMP1516]|uniref:Helicase C-terminal domain-containing protein n=2 Tax=Emiliania huxleyi TaxID=2903 RepID=A0A0D3J4F9_EMIH1|nr:hypothetical protein EMIHUDRAFT_96119 [Emiliania huxleyi CCMP1516]EOD18394.1 hypothetical protein EMIHUDRAFT_96119 [Emiliania huxleyi CCMP1516]|eukprot:XP_005770823.1 hypothetical protein EMIHUDRAFT_96119 [Emiliania huxleyi CCMP1516]